MPTYQYACTECGHGFEAVQPFSDDALTECPQCQGRLRKVFSSVGIVFKGSGFYRNDSREKVATGGPKSDAKADTKAEATSDSGGTKPEAKPAAKTDSAPANSKPTSSGKSSAGSGSTSGRSSTEGSAA